MRFAQDHDMLQAFSPDESMSRSMCAFCRRTILNAGNINDDDH
jgi:hypothetical protein